MTTNLYFVCFLSIVIAIGLIALVGHPTISVVATPIVKESDPNDDAAYLHEVRSILDNANLTDREKVSLTVMWTSTTRLRGYGFSNI